MRLLVPVLALALLLPATAGAQAPTIVSANQEDGRITVRWELPSDAYENDLVELSRSRETNARGEFRDIVDVIPPRAAQRQATFLRVRPGTYYVHVSAVRKECGVDEPDSCFDAVWSEIEEVVVPESILPRRYRGTTGQGRQVSFTVDGRRVKNFRISYFAPCTRGFQRGRGLTPRMRLRRDGTFGKRIRVRFTDGSTGRVRIRGRLRGRKRARGTFRYRSRGSLAGACSTGTVNWRARA